MRAGIGLVGVLLGVGLLVWLFGTFSLPAAKEGKKIQEETKPLTGYGKDDKPATESFAVTGHSSGQKMTLEVTDVTPGGAMDTFYNLQVGDVITTVGDMELGGVSGGDEETAKTLVVSEGYQKQKPIIVKRGRQTLTLPLTKEARERMAAEDPFFGDTSSASKAPAAKPAPAPAPKPAKKSGGLSGQLDAIRDAAGDTSQQDQ